MGVTMKLVALLLIASVAMIQSAEMCGANVGGSVPMQFQPPTKNFGASSAPGGEEFLLGQSTMWLALMGIARSGFEDSSGERSTLNNHRRHAYNAGV